jgi:hypothetical protein
MPCTCSRDWVDYLSALGPTLATVFAGIATVHVYLRGEKFQRQLVRPLIVVHHQVSPGAPGSQFWHWRISTVYRGAQRSGTLAPPVA